MITNDNIINKYFDNVYVLNLEKDINKMNYMNSLLENENIKFERFNAIYGKYLTKEYIDNVTDYFCNNFCSEGMIGCALSHISIWKDIIKNKYNNSIILEDDIYFDKDYKINLQNSLNELPEDWDILYLGCGGLCNKNRDNLFKILFDIFLIKYNDKIINKRYIYIPEFPTGTYSYAISKNGCIKLLNIIDKITYHIDYTISSNYKYLNIYAVNPKCIYPNTNESSININKFPVSINNILKYFKDGNNIDYSWYFNLVLLKYKNIQFNSWSIIFIIFGFLSYYNKYILYIIALLFLIEIIHYNISYLHNLLYFIIGIFIGLIFYYLYKKIKYIFKNVRITEQLIIHTLGTIFGTILITNGIKYNLLGYLIPGILWFITNIIFLIYGEKVFNKYIPNKKILFPIFFMFIPALIFGLIVLYNTYKYNNQFIRFLVSIVIIVDLIHLYQYNKNLFIFIIILLLFVLYIIRRYNKVNYDDLSPLLKEDYNYLDKSDIIFIIPKYKNIPLTEYPDFIKKIKNYAETNNKELAMHGVTHSPEGYFIKSEFGYILTYEYIKEGIDIFEKSFGYKPKKFKAPCYNLHPHNKKILEDFNIEIIDVDTLILNKLYHNNNNSFLYYFNKFTNFY
jgi:glycosyl transferase family 25